MADKVNSIRQFFSKKQVTIPGFLTAFILGNVTNQLIKSFVDSILMPIIGLILSKKSLESLNFKGLRVGNFLSTYITWIVTILVLYVFIEYILEKVIVEEEDPQLKEYRDKYEENYYEQILKDHKGDIYNDLPN